MADKFNLHELPLGVEQLNGQLFSAVGENSSDDHAIGGITTTAGNKTWRQTQNALIGIANTWSIAFGQQTNAAPSLDAIFMDIQSSTAGVVNNQITIRALQSVSPVDPMQITLFDSAGVQFKDYRWSSPGNLVAGMSDLFVATWDGTNLLLYKNGILQTLDASPPIDDAGIMTDTARGLSDSSLVKDGLLVGSCIRYTSAIWSTVLTPSEIVELHNGGNWRSINLNKNFREYTSANSLEHWWQHGKDSTTTATMLQDWATNPTQGRISQNANLNLLSTTSQIMSVGSAQPGGSTPTFTFLGLGSNERLQNTTAQDVGVADVWSVEFVARVTGLTAEGTILNLKATDNANNEIRISSLGDANDAFKVLITDSAGTTIKDYRYNFFFSSISNVAIFGSVQVVITWDGTTLLVYRNGNLIPVTTTTTDISGTMTNTPRAVSIGCNAAAGLFFSGYLQHIAVWNSVLNATDAATIYNHAFPSFDLAKNCLGYSGADNLKHWWMMCRPPSTLYPAGTTITSDHVLSGGINVETDSANLTNLDYLTDNTTCTGGTSAFFNRITANTDTWLANSDLNTMGIANSWTVMYWVYNGQNATQGAFLIDGTVNGGNQISLTQSATSSRLVINVTDYLGVTLQDRQYNSQFSTAGLRPWFVSWNGTTCTVFNSVGAAVTAVITTTNIGGTMTDTPRELWIGANRYGADATTGAVSCIAIWNTEMTADIARSITQMYRPGLRDLRENFGGYTIAANLKHLWLPGYDVHDKGRDYVVDSPINLNRGSGPGNDNPLYHMWGSWSHDT